MQSVTSFYYWTVTRQDNQVRRTQGPDAKGRGCGPTVAPINTQYASRHLSVDHVDRPVVKKSGILEVWVLAVPVAKPGDQLQSAYVDTAAGSGRSSRFQSPSSSYRPFLRVRLPANWQAGPRLHPCSQRGVALFRLDATEQMRPSPPSLRLRVSRERLREAVSSTMPNSVLLDDLLSLGPDPQPRAPEPYCGLAKEVRRRRSHASAAARLTPLCPQRRSVFFVGCHRHCCRGLERAHSWDSELGSEDSSLSDASLCIQEEKQQPVEVADAFGWFEELEAEPQQQRQQQQGGEPIPQEVLEDSLETQVGYPLQLDASLRSQATSGADAPADASRRPCQPTGALVPHQRQETPAARGREGKVPAHLLHEQPPEPGRRCPGFLLPAPEPHQRWPRHPGL
eukprot:scaffold125_cov240-Pinguiococcus_pyrenoidosus.AAC.8